MELDDLQRTWKSLDRQLRAGTQSHERLLRDSAMGKANTALTRLSRWLWIELLLLAGLVLWLGSFLWVHGHQVQFLLSGATVQVFATVRVAACVHQITAVASIDYGTPVVDLQKTFEALRVQRVRATKWTLLSAPLLWLPLFVVMWKQFFSFDVVTGFGMVWLAVNVVFGLGVIAVGVWAARRYSDQFKHSSFLQRLVRDIAGQNLVAATEYLRSLSEFDDPARP